MFYTNVTDGTFFDATILPELSWICFVQVSICSAKPWTYNNLNLFNYVLCFFVIIWIWCICVYIIHRDTSSPITPLKSLDSPLLYGYKSANNSESSSSNSSGNSPNNTSNSENLNLIDLIVSIIENNNTLNDFIELIWLYV